MSLPNITSKITESATDNKVLVLSWNIATEPKLYRELAQNPYSLRSRQIISERFPDFNFADVVKAVVLAEPEGKYDRDIRQLSKELQDKKLLKQKTISDEINKRLVQYSNKNAKELSLLPQELAYNKLTKVIFGTVDFKKIEQKYAQDQRRDFRLSIVNLIKYNPSIIDIDNEKPAPSRLLVKIVFAALSCLILFYLIQIVQNKTHNTQTKKQIPIGTQKVSSLIPVRLKIPIINVDAEVEYVGITSEGAMEVPSNTIDVGWFALGPHPGEKGSAVIAGHFDGENDNPGVFNNLNKLKKGDRVYIENGKGTTIIFVVRDKRTYDPGYAKDVFRQNDKAHLNLITCDGAWDGSKKSYTKRLVVFADILALDSN